MQITKTKLEGVVIIEPKVFGDDRGYFLETYNKEIFEEAIGYSVNFIQDNESKSSFGVLRGLHFQLPPFSQSKLVRVIEGSVLDVAVDMRKGSPTFGQYVAVELSAENKQQLFVPRGFAHGFLVTSETAIFAYKVDNYYAPDHDRGVIFNDTDIDIDWGIDPNLLLLSDKDNNLPSLKNAEVFDFNKDLYE
ncbi:MAG TPA: dTDP-4-dehydrorhamnose 3,5-epimerase [Campylobacterales bacterium]|nr:dTDP-4-dehydrorhamnose 3,5-epimerase [Campylobacterales bacterium]